MHPHPAPAASSHRKPWASALWTAIEVSFPATEAQLANRGRPGVPDFVASMGEPLLSNWSDLRPGTAERRLLPR